MILNAYATLFIATRLLLHRRMVIACVQDKALATQHTHIIGILLESAAVNLPVTFVAVIVIGVGDALGNTMLAIVGASQVSQSLFLVWSGLLKKLSLGACNNSHYLSNGPG